MGRSTPRLAAASLAIALACARAAAAPPAGSLGAFEPHVTARALSYHHACYALDYVGLAWSLAGFAAVLFTPLNRALATIACRLCWTREPAAPGLAATVAYYALLTAWLSLWEMPISVAWMLLERKYGFGTQTLLGLLGDEGTDWAVGLVGAPLLWLAMRAWRMRGPRVWTWIFAAALPVLFTGFVLEPILVEPLFNRYTPLAAGPERTQILQLARRAGASNATILVQDTSRRSLHVNAYVIGIGPSARVVINDTALTALPRGELYAMVAHELGHYAERHALIQFGGAAVGLGLYLFVLSRTWSWIVRRLARRTHVTDESGLGAIALLLAVTSIAWLIQAPVANAGSRLLEHRADAFGLRLCHDGPSMARLFVRFAEVDYIDPNPPVIYQDWFGTHPTLRDRIAFALSYRP